MLQVVSVIPSFQMEPVRISPVAVSVRSTSAVKTVILAPAASSTSHTVTVSYGGTKSHPHDCLSNYKQRSAVNYYIIAL